MDEAPRFEMREGIAVFRPMGQVRLERAIVLIREAIEAARGRGIRKLMIVTSGLEGLGPLQFGDRAYMARAWAEAAGRLVQIALVARPELIDAEKFGVIFARNFGISVDSFVTEAEALAWLAEGESAASGPPVALEMLGDVAVFRAGGDMRWEQAVALGKATIEAARRAGARKLLIDTTGAQCMTPPSVGDRALMAREWAAAAGSALHIAVLTKPEMIDPEKLGMILARQFGASIDVFLDEMDALAWLEQRR